jgi:hypothetical protein
MEVFTPDRNGPEALALVARLKQLGIRGRDAAYLASVEFHRTTDECVRENYLAEFRFMVAPDRREEAARLIQLESW